MVEKDYGEGYASSASRHQGVSECQSRTPRQPRRAAMVLRSIFNSLGSVGEKSMAIVDQQDHLVFEKVVKTKIASL